MSEYIHSNNVLSCAHLFEFHRYQFTRRPVVVRAFRGDDELVFIALHIKSKYIAKGQAMWESREPDQMLRFVRRAVRNRRRIAAECCRIRKCVTDVIHPMNPSAYIFCAGDMNDGPGLNMLDERFLVFDR